MSDASTPLMRQYHAIKQQVPNTLLMFRLGDFYELFFEDAVTAARELEITLTARNKEKGAAIPMCGVPYHAAEGYIARLIQKGYRVAICDQMEDPQRRQEAGEARGHPHRHARHGDGRATCCARTRTTTWPPWRRNGARAGVAHVDVSTGEFRVTEIGRRRSRRRARAPGRARSAVPGRPAAARRRGQAPRFLRTELEDWIFGPTTPTARCAITSSCSRSMAAAWPNRAAAVGAAGAILHYLRDTQRAALDHLDRPTFYDRADAHGARRGHGAQPGTGRAALRRRAAQGSHAARRARSDLHRHGRPPAAPAAAAPVARIAPKSKQRLDAVGELLQQTILRAELRKELGGILDLERLLAKVTLGTAGPRDLLALGRSLEKIPALKQLLRHAAGRAAARHLTTGSTKSPKSRDRILDAIADEPPVNLADGGTIRAGFNAELDELRDLSRNGQPVHRADRSARARSAPASSR